MKGVLICTKCKLNQEIGYSKSIVGSELIELVINCAKSKLNQAIGNTKVRVNTKLKDVVLNQTMP
jgi:hypothetical protein